MGELLTVILPTGTVELKKSLTTNDSKLTQGVLRTQPLN